MGDIPLKKFHHVSIAVNDAEKVSEIWSKVMGIGPWSTFDIGGTDAKGRPWKSREYHAWVGDVDIELIQPIEGRIIQSHFLDNVGPGLHHIAFAVDDVEKTVAELLKKGAELIMHDPDMGFAYLRTGAPDGCVIEVLKL